jgi:DNA-binding NtrC family response regulator
MDSTPYPKLPVLMVDDEIHLLNAFDLTLADAGITNTILCTDSTDVESLLSKTKVQLIMLDLSMPHLTGEDLLKIIGENYPEIPIVVITGSNDIETAVRCMQAGASDYLVKPVEPSRLVSCIKNIIKNSELKEENYLLKQRIFSNDIENPDAFSEIVTNNDQMKSMFQYMEAIANTTEPILITGETGVGKELIAKSIHKLSGRKGKFVTINIAGLDDQMFTDTLFGHKKGAFTNADSDRAGLIEKAKGGTLFLDEIGDLGTISQVKLLRLLQEHEYYPLGEDEPKYSDALVVVATNQDLYHLKVKKVFRNDLFYRLNVHRIHPIPLRERLDDIPILVDHFLELAAKALKKPKPTPPPELFKLLAAYHFPGNIRELQAMVFDAVSTHKSKILSMDSFKRSINQDYLEEQVLDNYDDFPKDRLVLFSDRLPTLKQVQNALIDEAMVRAQNNQSIAAQLLGVTRQALSRRLRTRRIEE